MSKCGSQSLLKKDGDRTPPDDTGRQLLSVRGVVCDGWWVVVSNSNPMKVQVFRYCIEECLMETMQ